MTTTSTFRQPYTTKALIRAMAPIDMVIDSFLRELALPKYQNFKCCDAQGHGGEHNRSPWSSPSQGRFASLIATISMPNCTHLDWTTCHFLPSHRYISKLVSRYITRMEKEHQADGEAVELEDDHLVSLVCHFAMSSRIPTSVDPFSSCTLTFEVPIGMVSSELKSTTNTCTSISGRDCNESDVLQIRTFPHHNDVGLKLWEAGACLSEYLIQSPELIRAKNVVELGAGVGLTGLIAAVCGGGARSLHMTDYTEATLDNLSFNVERNAEWLNKRGADVRSISVGFLEWGDYSDWQEKFVRQGSQAATNSRSIGALLNADVLLAADVVYDVQCIPDLVHTVHSFLSSGKSNEHKAALFATTYRNKTTFDQFENELENRGIICYYMSEQFQEEMPNIFPCYFNQPRSDVRTCTMQLGLTKGTSP